MRAEADGTPRTVRTDSGWQAVVQIRDHWRVEDLWWTERPERRFYYELELESGEVRTVFREVTEDAWYEQRAP